ncbi:hypothetical protein Srubr_08740 [Streptomyces rubradiris]|uniref:Uncharacterized protein n=1 Tax=Streptomyces rubradiris TaxID=285531 RepID=A0ABQ3R5C9_STRRR|nr:hypothetical protein GCM10018792_68000 [Streptomyces rubradiris]GHI51028.1 hypothetical protein Srubr_08740 [Streptomyces rubradiris]
MTGGGAPKAGTVAPTRHGAGTPCAGEGRTGDAARVAEGAAGHSGAYPGAEAGSPMSRVAPP